MTQSTFGDDPIKQVYVSINLLVTIFSTLATIVCILIIYRMKHRTGHLQLLLWMDYFHTIFDMTIFTANVDVGNGPFRIFSYVIGISSGVSDAIMNDWIAFVAWYIVVYKKPFYVAPNFHWIIASAIIPGLACGFFYLYCAVQNTCVYTAVVSVYDNTRIILIGINFLLIFYIMYKLEVFSCETRRNKTEQEVAVRTVAIRLIPYPIMQAISRGAITWYNVQFGEYRNFDNLTAEKYACLLFLTVSALLVSVGFLIVMLVTQPHAYDHFLAIMRCENYIEVTSPNEIDHDALENDSSTLDETPSKSTKRNKKTSSNGTSRKSSQKVSTNSLGGVIDRDSLRYSFYDSRTEDELMEWMDEECAITKESMFVPPKDLEGSISLTDISNPILRSTTSGDPRSTESGNGSERQFDEQSFDSNKLSSRSK